MHPRNTSGIRWLGRSQRVVQKLVLWIEAIQSGIFMGLLDDEAFQVFDTYPFDETKPLDVTAEAERGLEPWERLIVHDHLTDAESVLVLAAGGARELVGFSELGYDAVGIEYGQVLCDASQRELTLRNSSATIRWSERFEVPAGDKLFDAAFVARKFLSHVHDRSRRIELLASIRKVLQPDAALVIGFYTRERDTLAFRLQAALANVLRKLRGQRKSPIEVGDHLDPKSPLFHHHYVWEEVRDELREAGFTPVEHEASWCGWAVARPVSINTLPPGSPSDNREASESSKEVVESY